MGGGGLIAQKYQPKYLREDDQNFKNLTVRTDNDGWIEFKKDAKLNPNTFFKDYAGSLGLGKEYDFKILKDETDKKQRRQQHYQLYYKNILVEGAVFSLHSENDVLTIGHGKIPDGLNQDVFKSIPEPKALEFALTHMKVTLDDIEKIGRKKPEGVLLLARPSDEITAVNFRLCYTFSIYGNETLNAFKVYVDATTGEIVKKISLIRNCFGHNHTALATSIENQQTTPPVLIAPVVASAFVPNYLRFLNGQADLTFDTSPRPNTNNEFWLRSFSDALITQRVSATGGIEDVVNNGNDWRGNTISRNAQTAHWLTQRMFQFMSQSPAGAPIGRNGANGNGSYPRVVTDYLLNDFASYTPSINRISFGRSNNNSLVTIDVVGHEYMHAVTQAAVPGDLEYQGQSGALNESISDIFGTALERNILPNNWNWDLGEDCGIALRNMANPLASLRGAQPDRLGGQNWANTCNNCPDNGGVHTNSGVMNRWFNMLCTGFNNPNSTIWVNAIDFDRALAIVYRALTTYTQQYSVYYDMRNATIYAARDLYGDCSMEMRQVQNAWSLVGANDWNFCPADCNYTITPTSNNSTPSPNSQITLTANCTGTGCQGISYQWFLNSNNLGTEQTINTTVSNNSGSYVYSVSATKLGCNFSVHNITVNVMNSVTCPNTGNISYQRWENIGGGTSIQDLRNNTNNLNNSPSNSQNLTLFEAPTNILDNYGVRMRGYVCPPTSGNYTFWVAGDDNAELWLSPNEDRKSTRLNSSHVD